MDNSLTIYIDMANIHCYLAMEPTFALIKEFNLDVTWLPIFGIVKTVANRKPVISSSDELSQIKTRRLDARSRYEARELERNAVRLNIPLEQAMKSFDPKLLHIALLYFNQCDLRPETFIQEAIAKAFSSKVDVEDPVDVSRLIEKEGLSATGYLEFIEAGEIQLNELQSLTLEQGIFDAPAYQFRGENYQGRAHLPLIKWYLNGALGTAPT